MVIVLKRLHFPWGLAPSAPEQRKHCQLCLLKTNLSGFIQTFPLRFCWSVSDWTWQKLWGLCSVWIQSRLCRCCRASDETKWNQIFIFVLVRHPCIHPCCWFWFVAFESSKQSRYIIFVRTCDRFKSDLNYFLTSVSDVRTGVKIIRFAWIIFLSYIILWVSHFSRLSSFMWSTWISCSCLKYKKPELAL